MIKVPQVDGGYATLEVHFPILVEGSIGIDLQLA